MHGNPFADADADGCELAIFHPDSGESVAATGLHTEALAGTDERFFEFPQVFVKIFAAWCEIEDRVADELAGAVVGGLAAAVRLMDGVREGGWITQGRAVAETANRVNRQVLQQKNRVVSAAVKDRVHLRLLEAEACGVFDGCGEVENFQQGGCGLSVDLHEAALEEFRLEWIGGLKVCHADGECVCGVGWRSFSEAEDGADHECDLAFVGIAIADDGHFNFLRGVFVNFQAVVCGGDECGGAGGPHGNGGLVRLDVDDALDGDLVGLKLLDDMSEVRLDGRKCGGLDDSFRDGNHVEREHRRFPRISLKEGVAGVANCWVDGEDAHGESRRGAEISHNTGAGKPFGKLTWQVANCGGLHGADDAVARGSGQGRTRCCGLPIAKASLARRREFFKKQT